MSILKAIGSVIILLLAIGLPTAGIFWLAYDGEVVDDAPKLKTYDLTVKDYSIYCIDGVKYVATGKKMAPKISKETLQPERCEG